MACVLVCNYRGFMEPVYNFSSLRVACRTALSLMIGKNVYKDLTFAKFINVVKIYINAKFVGEKHFELWTKDAITLDYKELENWYKLGYDDSSKAISITKNYSSYHVPKAKTLGLKYKDYRYQIYWAAWKDAWYDKNYAHKNTPSRKLI